MRPASSAPTNASSGQGGPGPGGGWHTKGEATTGPPAGAVVEEAPPQPAAPDPAGRAAAGQGQAPARAQRRGGRRPVGPGHERGDEAATVEERGERHARPVSMHPAGAPAERGGPGSP